MNKLQDFFFHSAIQIADTTPLDKPALISRDLDSLLAPANKVSSSFFTKQLNRILKEKQLFVIDQTSSPKFAHLFNHIEFSEIGNIHFHQIENSIHTKVGKMCCDILLDCGVITLIADWNTYSVTNSRALLLASLSPVLNLNLKSKTYVTEKTGQTKHITDIAPNKWQQTFLEIGGYNGILDQDLILKNEHPSHTN